MVSGTALFLGLFNNLAIFIVLVAAYGVLNSHFENTAPFRRQFVLGICFGGFAIGCMYAKIPVAEGVIVDQRNAIVALGGAFGGPLSAVIGAAMAGAYRITLGGSGAFAGTVGVTLSALAGAVFHALRHKVDSIAKAAFSALAATIAILPGFLFWGDLATGWGLLKEMVLPYGSAVFIGIFFVGLLLAHQDHSHQAEVELRESEKRYRESEERLELALSGANEGIWDWDLESGAVHFDSRYYLLSGYPPNAFPATFEEWEKRVHPDDIQRVKTSIQQYLTGAIERYDVEFRFLHQNGDYMWIQGKGKIVARSEKGEPLRFVGTHSDVGARKRTEEELRQLRNYLSNIINSMPSVLVGVDREGKVTQWNHQAERVTGLTFGKAKSRPLADVFPRLKDEMDNIGAAIRNRRVIRAPKAAIAKPEETRYEDVTIFPLVANGVEGAVIRVDDVTEQVLLEQMMIQSEKMLSLGGLAAGMAHEINNPLAGILQNAAVLENRLFGELPANHRAAEAAGVTMAAIQRYLELRKLPTMIENIRISGTLAADIVKNMLSFARKSDNIVSTHDLGRLLDQTVDLLKTDYDMKKHHDFKQIGIVRHYAETAPPVPCEAGKIQQVFMNILKNGAEAMTEAVNATAAPKFVLRVRDDGVWVRVEIEDNGPGMDAQTRRRIFEPFFTTKPAGKGTGLGLSVSYFIIAEEHGGEMDAHAAEGGGTRFVIRLPKAGRA